jgi:hypothetical protein
MWPQAANEREAVVAFTDVAGLCSLRRESSGTAFMAALRRAIRSRVRRRSAEGATSGNNWLTAVPSTAKSATRASSAATDPMSGTTTRPTASAIAPPTDRAGRRSTIRHSSRRKRVPSRAERHPHAVPSDAQYDPGVSESVAGSAGPGQESLVGIDKPVAHGSIAMHETPQPYGPVITLSFHREVLTFSRSMTAAAERSRRPCCG